MRRPRTTPYSSRDEHDVNGVRRSSNKREVCRTYGGNLIPLTNNKASRTRCWAKNKTSGVCPWRIRARRGCPCNPVRLHRWDTWGRRCSRWIHMTVLRIYCCCRNVRHVGCGIRSNGRVRSKRCCHGVLLYACRCPNEAGKSQSCFQIERRYQGYCVTDVRPKISCARDDYTCRKPSWAECCCKDAGVAVLRRKAELRQVDLVGVASNRRCRHDSASKNDGPVKLEGVG